MPDQNRRLMANRLNRRRWMQATAAGGATLFAAELAWGQAETQEPLSFLVVSDTHLGRNGDSSRKRWEQTAAELARRDEDLVLHLGDVVNAGDASQYPIYKEIRNGIGKNVVEIPGNHDPSEAFGDHLRRPIDATLDHGWLRFVLLNNSRRDSHDGFFTGDQLKWFAQVCAKSVSESRRILICCHVPVHANKHPDRGWHVKPQDGQTAFYELVDRYRHHVVGVFHGHFHNGIRGWSDRAPAHEICFPSALYNQDRGLEKAGAEGYNPSEFRPGYCSVRVGAGRLQIQYHVTGTGESLGKTLSS